MTGLNIDTPHFNEDDKQLIQSYWEKLISDGYKLQKENILVLNQGSSTEKIFIVNEHKGYIKHSFKTLIIDRFFNISNKLMASGMKNYPSADILYDMIVKSISKRIIEQTRDYKFEKIGQEMMEHLQNNGYSIGPFKELPSIAVEAFYDDKENQNQYTYIFVKSSRKIYLDESTSNSKSRSHLTFDELENLNIQRIMKLLLDKNKSKKGL